MKNAKQLKMKNEFMTKETPYDIVLEANKIQKEYFKDLFRYRELFYFLAWRDILVRYKQTFFGVAWAVIRPLLNMAVFVLIFGKFAQLPSNNVSYPLFVFAGLLPWQLFSSSMSDGGQSLVNNSHMISKIYFPRVLIPTSFIVVNFVDFLLSFSLLIPFLIGGGYFSYRALIGLPFFIFLTLLLSVGTTLWLAALTVRFRDFRFIIPFMIQFGLFISPVGYATTIVPESWRWAYFLNPIVGIIDGFRWSLFGIYNPDFFPSVATSILVIAFFLIFGFRYFRRTERTFADII